MKALIMTTATIRLDDLKKAARALRCLPTQSRHSTLLNTLARELGLGEDFSGAKARARARGHIDSAHLLQPTVPATQTTVPELGLLVRDEKAMDTFLVTRIDQRDRALADHPGYIPFVLMADFTPEVWQNDYAVPVDAEGETQFDVTDFVLRHMPQLRRSKFEDVFEYGDTLRHADTAPTWVKDYSGPFTCSIADFAFDDFLESLRNDKIYILDNAQDDVRL